MSLRFEGTEDYVATGDLKVAVNASIALERPLLIKGEPGTGKTVLEAQGRHQGGRRGGFGGQVEERSQGDLRKNFWDTNEHE